MESNIGGDNIISFNYKSWIFKSVDHRIYGLRGLENMFFVEIL